MPSPFPGMDPFLEAPDLWPDFHERFATELSKVLNGLLPKAYYARLEMRPEIGIVGDSPGRIVPDVAIARINRPIAASPRVGGTAVLEEPRAALSPSVLIRVPNEPLRHHFVEVRDATRGHVLITLIEIVSPSNKRPGADRRAYLAKQEEICNSDTSLIELDFLRSGQSLIAAPISDLAAKLEPPPDYLVTINRAWQRGAKLEFEVYSVRLEGSLPCISVPLREDEQEPVLDLQYVFQQTYDGGPYARGAVDYDQPPDPPVSADRAVWLKDCVERYFLR